MFKVIIPSYKAGSWLNNCLTSVQNQSYKEFEVCAVDDCSPDDEGRDIISKFCKDNNWKYLFNKDRQYSLKNFFLAAKHLDCKNDDIIITIDGDDWLYDNNVFEKVKSYYDSGDIHLTYGQYISTNGTDSKYYCFKPSIDVIKKKAYRKVPWLFTHLKTFRYKLMKSIRVEHLKDIDGEYFKVASDLALMYPMVEMCGDKFYCSDDILYVYNEGNPISDFRIAKNDQARADSLIRRLPVYPTIV